MKRRHRHGTERAAPRLARGIPNRGESEVSLIGAQTLSGATKAAHSGRATTERAQGEFLTAVKPLRRHFR